MISGIKEVQPTLENPVITGTMSAGLVYFRGELFEFKRGIYKNAFSIVENVKTITGTDLNNNPYSTILKERYLMFDAAGLYSFSNLIRAEIADRRGLFDLWFENMPLTNFNANFTRQSPGYNNSVFQIDQFGRLINNQIIIAAISYVDGSTADIEVMTIPTACLPKLPSGIDRFFFTAYLYRAGSSPERTYLIPAYIILSSGKLYLQTYGNAINAVYETDKIYLSFEYLVR